MISEKLIYDENFLFSIVNKNNREYHYRPHTTSYNIQKDDQTNHKLSTHSIQYTIPSPILKSSSFQLKLKSRQQTVRSYEQNGL